jgi:hypothetical protein
MFGIDCIYYYKFRDWINQDKININFLYLNPHPAAEEIVKEKLHLLNYDFIDAICQDMSGERQQRMLEYYNFTNAEQIEEYIKSNGNGWCIKWYLITRFPFAIDVLEKYIPDKTKWFWGPLSINPEIFVKRYDYDSMKFSNMPLKEELMMNVFHPSRISKYLENGGDIEDLI